MYITHFLYAFVNRYLGGLHLLAIEDNATVNMVVQISPQDPVFNSFGYIHRSGIAESYSSSIFKYLRNRNTVFHSNYAMVITS